MLTGELIKGQEALKDLSDVQVNALVNLSQNDENAVIARKFGEIHGEYDEMFSGLLGVQKPQGTKSSQFWKEQVQSLKTKADGAGDTEQVNQLKAQISDLETQIKDGKGDAALITKLEKEKADLTATVEDLRSKYSEAETDWKTRYQEKEAEFKQMEIIRLFKEETADLKYLDSIPEDVRKIVIATAEKELLSSNEVEIATDQTGRKWLEYKKDGAILSNKENGLNPFTSKELFSQIPSIAKIIDTGKQQNGAGTKPGQAKGKFVGETVDVSGAKTKSDAMRMIKDSLSAQGISVNNPKYKQIVDKTWKEVVEPMSLDTA